MAHVPQDPQGDNWFYTLGSATLFAFLNQAVTGVFLSMFYDPSPTRAYESVRYITNEAFLGEFVRGMHKWGSSVMIVLIFLHMARTFFFGAYKYPRELNWVIGVVLVDPDLRHGPDGLPAALRPALLLGHRRREQHHRSGPLVGPYLADFLRAGPDFGATTLSRFYAIHMLLVPGAIAALIGAHLYLVAKLGTTAPPWLEAEEPEPCGRSGLVARGDRAPCRRQRPRTSIMETSQNVGHRPASRCGPPRRPVETRGEVASRDGDGQPDCPDGRGPRSTPARTSCRAG